MNCGNTAWEGREQPRLYILDQATRVKFDWFQVSSSEVIVVEFSERALS